MDGRGGILEFFLVMTTALVVAAADVSVGVVIGVAVAARSMGNVRKVVVGLAFRGGVRSRLGRVRVDCRRPIVDAAAG